VCASHDPGAFRYSIQIRLQPPRVEIIQDLEAIVKDQLLYFAECSYYLPNRIIFYRDGVSEGQFAEVCFKIIG
jgi:eukaryotic translation initiation factor 2C